MDYINSLASASTISSLTVLAAPGKCLTKTFAKDASGDVVKTTNARAATFRTYRPSFVGIDRFAGWLRQLQGEPECCVIRGVPGKWHPERWYPGEGNKHRVRRLLHSAVELADDATTPSGPFHKPGNTAEEREAIGEGRLRRVTVLPMFDDAPVDWVLLDFEKIEHPSLGSGWRADLAGAAAFLREQLPAAFHDARCVYYATSSAADLTKPDLGGADIRMRLGFLLSRGITGATAKRWLKGTQGLDLSTLRPEQPIYTAAPLFLDGLTDPLPDRLGVLPGAVERVAVPDALDVAPRKPAALMGRCNRPKGSGCCLPRGWTRLWRSWPKRTGLPARSGPFSSKPCSPMPGTWAGSGWTSLRWPGRWRRLPALTVPLPRSRATVSEK